MNNQKGKAVAVQGSFRNTGFTTILLKYTCEKLALPGQSELRIKCTSLI